MQLQDSFDYAMTFFQGGEPRHLEPVPARLFQRACRATQFQGVSQGFLPTGLPCHARLVPVGLPKPRGVASPFPLLALQVVVQSDRTTFVRELGLSAFLPWARAVATLLTQQGRLTADTPYDLYLLATPVSEDGRGYILPPFTISDRPVAPVGSRETSLHPALDYADDVPIVMPVATLNENLAFCRADSTVERAGVFLGYLCRDKEGGLFVEARYFCPALHTEAASATIRFTRETWAVIHQRRRELGPDLQVVGWSHSHPRVAVEGMEKPVALFLSHDDIAIMAAFFDLPHLFAIVVDAQEQANPAAACAAFGWDQTGVGLVQRSLNLYEEECEP